MVENLRCQNVQVRLVELSEQLLPPLDRELTRPLEEVLKRESVMLHLGDSLERIEKVEEGLKVHLKSGFSAATDMVIMGVGVRPESGLAVQALFAGRAHCQRICRWAHTRGGQYTA